MEGGFLLKRSGLNAGATQAPLAVIPVHFFRRKRVARIRTSEWATKGDALHDHADEEAEIEDPADQVPPSRPGLYQVFSLELMMTPWTIT